MARKLHQYLPLTHSTSTYSSSLASSQIDTILARMALVLADVAAKHPALSTSASAATAVPAGAACASSSGPLHSAPLRRESSRSSRVSEDFAEDASSSFSDSDDGDDAQHTRRLSSEGNTDTVHASEVRSDGGISEGTIVSPRSETSSE